MSEDEGEDWHAEMWVILKLSDVSFVFSFGPGGLLNETYKCEESHCQKKKNNKKIIVALCIPDISASQS